MKKLVPGSILAAFLLMMSSAASADSFIHLWTCKLGDDASQEDMMQWSQDWLKAAKSVDGGADFKVYLEYPLAAQGEGGTFNWILVVPDLASWGTFMDAYPDSAAAEVDDTFEELGTCSGSSLWASLEVTAD